MTQNALGNVQSYPNVSIYRNIIVIQEERVRTAAASVKDESNPPDIVIRLRSVSGHSRVRSEMIGGGATEEREPNESKKEGRGCVGSPRTV